MLNKTDIEVILSEKAQKNCIPEIKRKLVIPEYIFVNNNYFKVRSIGENAFSFSSLKKIIFIAKITKIGASAFSNSPKLEEIDLSMTQITSIPTQCFINCPSLNRIILPKTIEHINDSAFENTGLIEFSFNDLIVSAGERVFANCKNLEKVDFSKTKFTFIPKFMFFNCISLKIISIPPEMKKICECALSSTSIASFSFDKINKIKKSAFSDCKSLTKVDLSESSINILDERVFYGCCSLVEIILPNTLREISKEALMNTSVLNLIIPETLVQIGESSLRNCAFLQNVDLSKTSINNIPAFLLANCTKLQNISIPDTVEIIGESAFENSGIKSVDISNCNTEIISMSAFKNCRTLEYFLAPSSLKEIETEAFMGSLISFDLDLSQTSITVIKERVFLNSKLSKIILPRYLTEIKQSSFESTSIKSIVTPLKLVEIGEYSFAFCSNLTEVDFSMSLINNLPMKVLFNCTKLANLILPDSIHTIDSQALSNTIISSIKLSAGLVSINDFAFSFCKGLKTIDLSQTQLTTIGDGSFYKCTALTKIEFPQTLEKIGTMAFYNSSLISLSVPNAKTLCKMAFSMCFYLRELDLSKSEIQIINDSLFLGCESLKTVFWPKKITEIGKLSFKNTGFDSISFPASLKTIKNAAFSNCKCLKSVNLVNCNMQKLSKRVFMNSTQLSKVFLPSKIAIINSHAFSNTSIETIHFPPTLELLRNSFENCIKLKEVDLSNTQVYVLESGLFAGCTSLSHITLPPQLEEIKERVFTRTKITKIKIPNDCKLNPNVFANTDITTVDLSETGFTELIQNLFADAHNIKEIIFPETLKTIRENAFFNTGIVELKIPYIKEFSTNAFTCSKLKKLDLSESNVEVFPPFSFAMCPELSEIILPNCLIDISANSFQKTKIAKIVLPELTATIEEEAFYNCHLLEEVDMSKTNIIAIGERVFYNCIKLKKVFLPESLQKLGQDAFSSSGIEEIEFPSTLRSIGERCFSQCSFLSVLNISGTMVREIYSNTLFNCKQLKTIVFDKSSYTLHNNLFSTVSISSIKLPLISNLPEKLFEKNKNVEIVEMTNCGLKTITDNFFGDCIKLKVVSLPINLETIGSYAFRDCFSLQKVYYCGTNKLDSPKLFNKGVYAYVINDYEYSTLLGAAINIIEKCVDVIEVEYI